jgi:hypothetical protein
MAVKLVYWTSAKGSAPVFSPPVENLKTLPEAKAFGPGLSLPVIGVMGPGIPGIVLRMCENI